MTPAIRMLEAAGIDHRVHEYERGADLRDFGREAAAALGLPEDQVFKTLVVDLGDELAVAVVPVSCRLSLRRVAAALGAKRAAMCDPERAARSTGYVVGGISPLGQKRRLRTVLDESAELFDTIFVSGGRRGLDVELSPQALVAALDALVADVSS